MLASHPDVLCATSRVTSPHKERRRGKLFHRRSAQHTKAGLRDQPKERPSLRLLVNPPLMFNSDVKLIKENKFFRAKFIIIFLYIHNGVDAQGKSQDLKKKTSSNNILGNY